jgi:predicted DsbA family dithiol-disulfide isomerase
VLEATAPVLEVFADVCCPFTHAGVRRFLAARDERGTAVALVFRAWPLEWVNGRPLDPDDVAEEVEALRASVAPDLFAGFRPEAFPATALPALGLAATAYERSADLGTQVSLALRDAVFEEGRDVADPAELEAIAARFGLSVPEEVPHPQVRADFTEGRRRGVTGSPHFFAGGRGFFCPSLRVGRDDAGHLRVEADPAALAEVLELCGPGRTSG